MRRGAWVALLTCLCLGIAMPTSAGALEPEQVVGGAGSKWFSGSLIEQTGENCSILGEPRTEPMVSGVASYGGVKGVPVVGQRYYTAFLISVPGDPCGTGSASVETDVVLPPFTTVDPTAPIRCFGEPRGASTFIDLTNESWSFDGYSGRYCPTAAALSSLHSGGLSFGFRPIASGQLFWIFVPVISSAPLVGAGHTPADGFYWLTDATGVYANPGLSEVLANVFSAPTGESPFIYFAHEPAVPYWEPAASKGPPDLRNRVEFFANLYTAQQGGELCWEILEEPGNIPIVNCKEAEKWNGTVASGEPDLLQVISSGTQKGPGGGYVPVAFPEPFWNKDFKIVWRFTYNAGKSSVTGQAPFHTLPGPDSDGDGVPDSRDECPTVKGTLPNGCLPPVQTDPDGDGVYGEADLCPTENGMGSLNGCPGGVVPTHGGGTTGTTPTVTQTPPSAVLVPLIAHRRASAARAGSRVRLKTGLTVSCPSGGAGCVVSLTVTVPASLAHGAASKHPAPLTIGRLSVSIAAGHTTALVLTLTAKGAALLKKHHRLKLTLGGTARDGGGPPVTLSASTTVAYPAPARKH